MVKVKTFIHALKTLSLDSIKAKTYLQDKRLTQNEKIILESFFYFRDNDLLAVTEGLSRITECSDPVVESQKQLLLGLTAINMSFFKKAVVHIEKSLELLKGQGLPYFEYIGLYNLFIIAFNQKNKGQMKSLLNKLKRLPLERPADQIMILRSFLNYYTFNNEFKKAHEMIEEIDLMEDELCESDAIGYQIDKINLSVKEENFEESLQILNQMKKYRKFHLTENFKFIKLLLDNLMKGAPLYFSDEQFNRVPLLYYQMKTIRALEEGQKSEAQIFWNKLAEINPEIYGEHFHFKGEKSLFSLALLKHLKNITAPEVAIDGDCTQHEKLLLILERAKAPVSRDFLYQATYGKKAETKDDYQRLSKVIYRLKVKLHLDISLKKGCYFLSKNRQAA